MGLGLQSYRLNGDPERHYTATRHGSLGKLDALDTLLRFEHGTKRRGEEEEVRDMGRKGGEGRGKGGGKGRPLRGLQVDLHFKAP